MINILTERVINGFAQTPSSSNEKLDPPVSLHHFTLFSVYQSSIDIKRISTFFLDKQTRFLKQLHHFLSRHLTDRVMQNFGGKIGQNIFSTIFQTTITCLISCLSIIICKISKLMTQSQENEYGKGIFHPEKQAAGE